MTASSATYHSQKITPLRTTHGACGTATAPPAPACRDSEKPRGELSPRSEHSQNEPPPGKNITRVPCFADITGAVSSRGRAPWGSSPGGEFPQGTFQIRVRSGNVLPGNLPQGKSWGGELPWAHPWPILPWYGPLGGGSSPVGLIPGEVPPGKEHSQNEPTGEASLWEGPVRSSTEGQTAARIVSKATTIRRTFIDGLLNATGKHVAFPSRPWFVGKWNGTDAKKSHAVPSLIIRSVSPSSWVLPTMPPAFSTSFLKDHL